MQVQNLIKRKYFGVILISVLIGLITLVSVGIKYIGMNKEKAGIEAIEEENRKVEEEAENKKEVENLLIITQYSMLIGRRLKSVV